MMTLVDCFVFSIFFFFSHRGVLHIFDSELQQKGWQEASFPHSPAAHTYSTETQVRLTKSVILDFY